jgi:thiol-disulfide isomerase/thioredoxin
MRLRELRLMPRRFLFMTAALVCATAAVRAEIKVGDRFPALEAAELSAVTGQLGPVAGKIILVDFWASWCAPCKASFPAMARLQQEFSSRGLVIAAISVDEKPAAAAAFAKKLAPPFPTLHDAKQTLVQTVAVPTMPTSYLVGRDGRVRAIHQGYHGDASERQLRKEIEALLAEKTTL